MKQVTSREYKVMLHPNLLSKPDVAVEALLDEVRDRSRDLGVKSSGKPKAPERRIIRFFDTPDSSFRRSGFVLRRRDLKKSKGIPGGETQLTLKIRSPDRYFAQGTEITHDKKLFEKEKLEEDIAAVFRSRFSHSVTLQADTDKLKSPKLLSDAAKWFPVLKTVTVNDKACSPKTRVQTVRSIVAHERVFKGPAFEIAGEKASIAVILWTRGWDGRPLAAEFSFRYGSKKEKYSVKLAAKAQALFEDIQCLDWCAPSIPTKTQYVYGET